MSTGRLAAIVLFSLAGVCDPTGAGDSHYECVILSAWTLTEKGTLTQHWAASSAVGTKFTVDRVTGRVMGGPLDNANLKVEVVDCGTREMSFQSFSRSTQRSHTSHIEIQEFVSGTEKPFLGTTTLYQPGVYSGTCN